MKQSVETGLLAVCCAMLRIDEVTERSAIASCFDVMVLLRAHLDRATFVETVITGQKDGYRLARGRQGEEVVAVAGFRIGANLAWGRFLYVDDLVTETGARSRGHGAAMLGWLEQEARARRCTSIQLDSGVQRFAAHRFYLRHGFELRSHHFSRQL